MIITRKKMLITFVITIILLMICFFVSIYLLCVKGEPYTFAVKYLDSNKLIEEEIGIIASKRLAFFGYKVSNSVLVGSAEYKIYVKGEHNEGAVYLKMKKSVGTWKVLEGNLVLNDGKTILLTKANGRVE